MSDGHSLKEDLKKSVLYHVVVVVCVVVYFIFGELAALTMQSRQKPESKELASIGVEFVKAQAKPSMHKAKKDSDIRRASEIKSQVNQVDKKDPMEMQKIEEKVNRKVRSEVKKLVETGVKKSELKAKNTDILKAKPDEKTQKQKKNVVKRQVSEIAKETKTATSKIIDLKKTVGQERKVTTAGMHKAVMEKSKHTQKSGGELKKSNAQVLAAKEVESAGSKIVKTGEVKKTVKKLTSKETEAEKKKQKALAIEKERQAKYAKHELEEKQRKLALAEKQRKLALAEKQRKQDLAEKQRQIRASYEADQIMKYGQMIVAHIQEVALFTEGMGQLSASLKIKLDTKGFVQGVSLTKTSGNASFDRLAVNAVYKASPLPLPEDEKISQKMASINLKISPSSLE